MSKKNSETGEEECASSTALENLTKMIQASITSQERAQESLREDIRLSTEASKEKIEEQRRFWEEAIEKGTSRCMEAITEKVAECTEKMQGIEDRVDALDEGFMKLQSDVNQMKNRTVKASANIIRDENQFATCRRSLVIWPVKFEKGQTGTMLKDAVQEFLQQKLKIGEEEYEALGDFKVHRPLPSGGEYNGAPVHIEFPSSAERDYVMSRSRFLRLDSGEKTGSIRMKVPPFLHGLKQSLEAEAKRLRTDGVWVQVRMVDSPEMLALYTKNIRDENAKWSKHESAFKNKKTFA